MLCEPPGSVSLVGAFGRPIWWSAVPGRCVGVLDLDGLTREGVDKKLPFGLQLKMLSIPSVNNVGGFY